MRFHIYVVLVLALHGAGYVMGSFLTDKEVQSATCHSAIQQTTVKLTVSNPPTAAIDLVTLGPFGSYTLDCIQVFESLTNAAQASAAQLQSCQSSNPTLSICLAPWDGTLSDANLVYTCTSLSTYLTNPVTTTTFNPPSKAAKMKIKFQWLPQLTTAACYPRDLTVLIVGAEPNSQGSSVAASVIFILIVVAVGLGVAVFALYQVRKSMSHFKRGENERAIPEDGLPYEATIMNKQLDGDDPTANGFDDVYVDHQPAYGVDEDTDVVDTHSFPKPWYQRQNYDLSKRPESISRETHDSRRLDFGSPGERAPPPQQLSATRRRMTPQQQQQAQPVVPPSSRGPSVRPVYQTALHYHDGANSLRDYDGGGRTGYSDDDEEDEVLVCGDCGLEIHNKATPQLCSHTGKRHY